LWIGGLLFSLPLLAVKVGFGLERGGAGRRQILLTYGMYLALFMGTVCWRPVLSGVAAQVMNGGPYLQEYVGVTMIVWGILAIHCLVPLRKRPRAPKDAWLLALPCPAYLVAMIVSVRLARDFTRLPAPAVGAALGAAFVALGGLSQAFLRVARGRPVTRTAQAAVALALFITGTYFVATTFLPGVLHDAGHVHASFIADGTEVETGHGPWLWLMLAAVAALGYFARGRSEIRS
jgi:predicted transporter